MPRYPSDLDVERLRDLATAFGHDAPFGDDEVGEVVDALTRLIPVYEAALTFVRGSVVDEDALRAKLEDALFNRETGSGELQDAVNHQDRLHEEQS